MGNKLELRLKETTQTVSVTKAIHRRLGNL